MAKTRDIPLYEYSAYVLSDPVSGSAYGNGYGYVGRENKYPPISKTTVTGCIPSYSMSQSLSAEAVIHSVTITISMGDSGGTHTAYAGALSQSVRNMSYAQMYGVISAAPKTWTLQTGKDTVIQITDPSVITQVLEYGVGITPGTSGTWQSRVQGLCAVEYSDPNEPPDVSITESPAVVYMADDIQLSWSYSQSADLAQTAVDVDLCTSDGAAAYPLAQKISTAAASLTVNLRSVKSFLQGGEGWVLRVRAYAKNGTLVSAWSNAPVTLKNITPAIVSPKSGENRLAASVIRLRWTKAEGDEAEAAPHGFTVQYSENAGETWTDLLVKGSASSDASGWYLDVPANTFRHGTIQWRVLVWDTAYQFGKFAKETFGAVVQASTSSVQCDGKPLPTISWTSSSQVAYQVRFADYDSGTVYGAAQKHRVPYVYEDGLYAAQVRTQATTGAWSDWTPVQYVQITNVPPVVDLFRFVLTKTTHAVTTVWDTSGTFAAYILYRGGVPIHVGTDRRYTDLYGNGTQSYFVRGITADGYYLQSKTGTIDATPDVDCLYDIAGDRWIPLKFSAEPRKRQYMTNERVSLRYYAGRSKPVAFTEGFIEHSGSFVCCTQNPAEAKEIERLAGTEVICKSRDGESIRGILNSVNRVSGQVQDVSFVVNEIDWEEKVKYETA